jgi:hypothetical protein
VNLGNAIRFSWPDNFKLQAQTNTLDVGLGTNWADYAGGATSPITVTIIGTNPAVFFRAFPIPHSTIYFDSGTNGTYMASQSYNETRAVDLTVLSPTSLVVTSMTLTSVAGGLGVANAVIYNSQSQSLIASAQGNVVGGTVTVPISATLVTGGEYRIGFYGQLGNGTLFVPGDPPYTLPGNFPYIDSSGFLQINNAWSISTDSFPTIPNLAVPLVRLNIIPIP